MIFDNWRQKPSAFSESKNQRTVSKRLKTAGGGGEYYAYDLPARLQRLVRNTCGQAVTEAQLLLSTPN